MFLYNAKSKQKEQIKLDKVEMYVCGPTLYSEIHIGNARPIITFDVLHRLFRALKTDIRVVSNITDIDDKIIAAASIREITEMELVEENVEKFQAVLKRLSILQYDYQPRVTEVIAEIIEYIEKLISLGVAYEVEGSVYFDISKVPNYGEISHRNLDDALTGTRVEIKEEKQNEEDFVLWKKTAIGQSWESPWGYGRPGWHTECVVMINKHLGNEITIHGGGMDLKFPHHENENAQASACGHNLAQVWVHNGMINIDNQKMSKSIGNVLNVREFLDEHDADYLKLLMLQTSYRQPLNLTEAFMEQTKTIQAKIARIVEALNIPAEPFIFKEQEIPVIETIKVELLNDLNTANALALALKETNKLETDDQARLWHLITYVFGLNVLENVESQEIPEIVQKLLMKRIDAKKAKNYEEADRIRLEILKYGYEVFDTREGVKWKRI